MSGYVDTLVLAAAVSLVERVAMIGESIAEMSLAHALLSSNIRDKFAPTTPALTMRMDTDIFESQ
jgi:hypothetical protein